MTVRARRLLTTPEAAEAFLVDLSAKLEDAANANVCPKFDDFDISQNPLSSDNFTALFGMFIDKGVGIQRMRLFGCATLDDTVAWQMAGWLSSLTQDTVPSEMHLSDCAITSEGFTAICDAFASNDAFPPRNGTTGAVCPMYMRLENNYIEQHVIQQKIEEGVLTYFMKNCGAPPNPNAKVKILVQMAGRFSQRAGQPPPPELAPPPKPVNDKNIVHGMPNAVRPVRPVMAASPVAQGMPMQQNLSPQLMTMQQKIAQQVMLQVQGAIRPGGLLSQNQAGNAAQRGAADRSRTPAPVSLASKAGPATKPVEVALPYPWEEHWSDEFGIAYYWNSKSGEAAWEKPVA